MRRPRQKFKVSFYLYFCCFWINVTQINFENIKRKIQRIISDSFQLKSWFNVDARAPSIPLLNFPINLHLKKRIVKMMVWSVLLYGSETWTLKTGDVKRLESFEMWVWRRIEKISWTERVSNDEVLRIVGEERMLMKTCKDRQKSGWDISLDTMDFWKKSLRDDWKEKGQEEGSE